MQSAQPQTERSIGCHTLQSYPSTKSLSMINRPKRVKLQKIRTVAMFIFGSIPKLRL